MPTRVEALTSTCAPPAVVGFGVVPDVVAFPAGVCVGAVVVVPLSCPMVVPATVVEGLAGADVVCTTPDV